MLNAVIQEKKYILSRGLFRGQTPVIQLLMNFIEFMTTPFAFAILSHSMGCALTDQADPRIRINSMND
jgi:hypothetical protein